MYFLLKLFQEKVFTKKKLFSVLKNTFFNKRNVASTRYFSKKCHY